MVELSIELGEKNKLTGANYLEWKSKVSSILQLKHLLRLVLGKETIEECELEDKRDRNRSDDALAILKINCDTKLAEQFDLESKGNPQIFWKLLKEHFQPKTVQNQATYLNRIFSTNLASHNLEETLNKLAYNTRQLCALIDDNNTKPSILLDSVIAMWSIINLPPEFKNSGELLLKKCQIKKKAPSIKEVVEEMRSFLQQNSDSQDQSKAFAAFRRSTPYYGPRCSPGYHNPKTKHLIKECSQINRPSQEDEKPTKAFHASHAQLSSETILDLGASHSMFNSRLVFSDLTPTNEVVYLADGSTAKVKGKGTSNLDLPHAKLKLSDSLYIPSLSSNLISLCCFIERKYSLVSSGPGGFALLDKSGKVVISGNLSGGNFIINCLPLPLCASVSSSTSALTKHKSAGHPSHPYLLKMFPSLPKSPIICTTCDISKSHKSPFLGSFPKASRRLDFLHVDLCGPISPVSISGSRYFLRAMDGFSHFVWICFVKKKSNVPTVLANLFTMIENQSSKKISHLVTDNGTEFKNLFLSNIYSEKGIQHLTTAPYTPEENPFSERGNRTTGSKIRCLLKDSNLSHEFWAEAANTSVYLENRTPC